MVQGGKYVQERRKKVDSERGKKDIDIKKEIKR
jgi:hypothetical protein